MFLITNQFEREREREKQRKSFFTLAHPSPRYLLQNMMDGLRDLAMFTGRKTSPSRTDRGCRCGAASEYEILVTKIVGGSSYIVSSDTKKGQKIRFVVSLRSDKGKR